LRITSVLIIFFAAATTQAQSLIPALSFKNPVLKTGRGCPGAGLDGAVYIFRNVGWNVDALVTILGAAARRSLCQQQISRGRTRIPPPEPGMTMPGNPG